MHLKQPGFTYSACGPFTKNKERIGKFMKTGKTDFKYKNELDRACFQHDVVYGRSKDLAKRAQPGKVLRDKAFKTASDPKYDGYRWFTSFLIQNLAEVVLVMEQLISLQMSFINPSLKHLRKEKFIYHIETLFEAFI